MRCTLVTVTMRRLLNRMKQQGQHQSSDRRCHTLHVSVSGQCW